MANAIGVGLCGFGLSGRFFHAPFLAAAGFDIRAAATKRSDDVRSALPNAQVVADITQLAGRDDIQLIIIATPNALHEAQARAAIAAKKHVVIEKPVLPDAQSIRSLDKFAREHGVIAAAYHNRRWDSDFLTLKRLLNDGAIGTPMRYVTSWNRHRAHRGNGWREQPGPGAGILYDLGTHLIDQALDLLGWPDWVEADIFEQRAPGGAVQNTDDGFELRLGKGALRISLSSSSFAAGPGRFIQLDGTEASFIKSGADIQAIHAITGMPVNDAHFGEEKSGQWGKLYRPDGSAQAIPSERGAWVSFYKAMRAAIESGAPAPVSLMQAANAIELIEAAFASAHDERRLQLPPR